MWRTSARSEARAPVPVLAVLLFLSTAAHAQKPECSIHPPKRATPAELARLAKITMADAEARAVASVAPEKPSSIVSSDLEVEDGCLVWSFDLRFRGKAGFQEVVVDAGDGKVLSKKSESASAEEAQRSKETPVSALVPTSVPQPAPVRAAPVGVLGAVLFVRQGEKVAAGTSVAASNACGGAAVKWSAATVYWGGSTFTAGTVGCGKPDSRDVCTQAASPAFTELGAHTVRISVEASCGGETPRLSDVEGTSFVIVLDKDGRLVSKMVK